MRSIARVVVIAGSIESIDALARLINQLPNTFPAPVVVHLHGQQEGLLARLTSRDTHRSSRLAVVHAQEGENLRAGWVYVTPVEKDFVFTAMGTMGPAIGIAEANVDHLFASAALWYQAGVIGVVLSGLGTDGTVGLRAITQTNGIRVVQSPSEAAFPNMPSSAIIGDDVQYSVMLDQMGHLLEKLLVEPEPQATETALVETDVKLKRQASRSKELGQISLDRSIIDILDIMRAELVMDIVFVSKQVGDDVFVSHATVNFGEDSIQGMSVPREQSLCQRVLDGRLPAMMPDVAALRLTHDVPSTSITPGSYMAAPVWLEGGALYGTLCCLSFETAPALRDRHHRRLQSSARQIARLVDEAGAR